MKVYFFGCIDQAGHFLWPTTGGSIARHGITLPWAQVDGTLTPGVREHIRGYPQSAWPVPSAQQVEGLAKLHRKGNWTALAWWDRSVDKRHGSNAALFAEGTHAFEDMLAIGRESFPQVFARFTYEIKEAT